MGFNLNLSIQILLPLSSVSPKLSVPPDFAKFIEKSTARSYNKTLKESYSSKLNLNSRQAPKCLPPKMKTMLKLNKITSIWML